MKAAVLGAGAWGTALAKLLAEKGADVSLWARRRELAEAIAQDRENARYLSGVPLPKNVSVTHDLGDAVRHAHAVLFVVPSHAMREVARAACPHLAPDALAIGATKGIETDSLLFMDEVLDVEFFTEAELRALIAANDVDHKTVAGLARAGVRVSE